MRWIAIAATLSTGFVAIWEATHKEGGLAVIFAAIAVAQAVAAVRPTRRGWLIIGIVTSVLLGLSCLLLWAFSVLTWLFSGYRTDDDTQPDTPRLFVDAIAVTAAFGFAIGMAMMSKTIPPRTDRPPV